MDLQQKPENFTAMYARALPRGRAKVPLLEILEDDSALPIPESMVVLEYLEDVVGPSTLTVEQQAGCRLFAQQFSEWMNYIPLLRAEEGSIEEEEALQVLSYARTSQLNDSRVARYSLARVCWT